jgi:hypothetical protein
MGLETILGMLELQIGRSDGATPTAPNCDFFPPSTLNIRLLD